MKVCRKRLSEKEDDAFEAPRRICRTCDNKRKRDWRKRTGKGAQYERTYRASPKGKAASIAASNRYRDQNPDKVREATWRSKGINITVAEFDRLAEAQEHKCAICTRKRKLCVDHCHATGKVRGLLCGSCNAALGLLNDRPTLLDLAAIYLEAARG